MERILPNFAPLRNVGTGSGDDEFGKQENRKGRKRAMAALSCPRVFLFSCLPD
jgi:hypothetical protein